MIYVLIIKYKNVLQIIHNNANNIQNALQINNSIKYVVFKYKIVINVLLKILLYVQIVNKNINQKIINVLSNKNKYN